MSNIILSQMLPKITHDLEVTQKFMDTKNLK